MRFYNYYWIWHLPAASLWMYVFNADDNWFEFSNAMQTFRMCGGILSKMPGSHRAGMFIVSLLADTFDMDNANSATSAITTIWYSISLFLYVYVVLFYLIPVNEKQVNKIRQTNIIWNDAKLESGLMIFNLF